MIDRPNASDIADLLRAEKSAQLLAWIDRAIDIAGDELQIQLQRSFLPISNMTLYLRPNESTIFVPDAPMTSCSATVTEQLTGSVLYSRSIIDIPSRIFDLGVYFDTDCVVTISGTLSWPGDTEQKTSRAWEYAAAVIARQFTEDTTGIVSLMREGISVQVRPLQEDPEFRQMIRSIERDLGRRWQA